MFTVRSYPYSPFEIFVDVVPTSHGWIVVPYKIGIDPSKPILHWVTPAMVEVVLGLIENGDYTFKVIMKNSTDIFQIHKADSEFWVEEVKAPMGSVAQKNEFEKRLDGFTITYGWAESNEIRLHALDLIKEANGEIVDTSIPEYPDPISIRFYFSQTFDKLSSIVLDLAKQYPNSSISIHGNDRHFSSTYTYVGTIFVLPEYADTIRSLIRRCGLVIYNEEIYETYSIEQGLFTEFIEIHISSASIEKTFSTIRSEIIERIQNELGLRWGFNNHFLVSP